MRRARQYLFSGERTQPDERLAGVGGVMERAGSVDELFERDYARLVRALGVAFDPEAAADAVQDAFVAADARWRRVAALDDPAGWVRHVALNRLRSGRRNGRRRAEILATIRPVPDDDLTDALLDLRRAIAALPDRMRLAVCLHYLGGFTVEEVATSMAVAVGTVKSTLHDGRDRLRLLLEVHDHG